MRKILLIIMLLLFSCSIDDSLRYSPKYKGIDPEIKPYVMEFIKESKGSVTYEDVKKVTMGFRIYDLTKKKNTGVLGTCVDMGLFREIDLNKEWWMYSSYIYRKTVIFHELGHCVLNRGHTEKRLDEGWFTDVLITLGLKEIKPRLKDGCPSSIMNPYVLNRYCLQKHYDYYIYELFYPERAKAYLSYRQCSPFIPNDCP